ncbi:MAG TPA: hypothetical protein VG711_07170, partial [Phycisphaerales bacterium]|nr:hypothetical protein [Phycisphaerales bacterium]
LLALAVASLIGVGVVTMLASTARATTSKNDLRRAIIQQQLAVVRLGSLGRSATMVLATTDSQMVLWKGDLNLNSHPDASELLSLDWDEATGKITTYEMPQPVAPSDDIEYDVTDDFVNLTKNLIASDIMVGTDRLSHVQAWTTTLDNASVQSARMITFHLTLDDVTGPQSLDIVTALRAEPSQ